MKKKNDEIKVEETNTSELTREELQEYAKTAENNYLGAEKRIEEELQEIERLRELLRQYKDNYDDLAERAGGITEVLEGKYRTSNKGFVSLLHGLADVVGAGIAANELIEEMNKKAKEKAELNQQKGENNGVHNG